MEHYRPGYTESFLRRVAMKEPGDKRSVTIEPRPDFQPDYDRMENMSARAIIDYIARGRGLTFREVTARTKTPHIVRVRNECIQHIKLHRNEMSLNQIGRIFNMHHTSVLYALGECRDRTAAYHYRVERSRMAYDLFSKHNLDTSMIAAAMRITEAVAEKYLDLGRALARGEISEEEIRRTKIHASEKAAGMLSESR